jgi:hypothetical protein
MHQGQQSPTPAHLLPGADGQQSSYRELSSSPRPRAPSSPSSVAAPWILKREASPMQRRTARPNSMPGARSRSTESWGKQGEPPPVGHTPPAPPAAPHAPSAL